MLTEFEPATYLHISIAHQRLRLLKANEECRRANAEHSATPVLTWGVSNPRNRHSALAIRHSQSSLSPSAIAGPISSNMQIAGVHGGGSPIMEDIAVWGQYDMEEKKNIAKKLAGIPIDKKK